MSSGLAPPIRRIDANRNARMSCAQLLPAVPASSHRQSMPLHGPGPARQHTPVSGSTAHEPRPTSAAARICRQAPSRVRRQAPRRAHPDNRRGARSAARGERGRPPRRGVGGDAGPGALPRLPASMRRHASVRGRGRRALLGPLRARRCSGVYTQIICAAD